MKTSPKAAPEQRATSRSSMSKQESIAVILREAQEASEALRRQRPGTLEEMKAQGLRTKREPHDSLEDSSVPASISSIKIPKESFEDDRERQQDKDTYEARFYALKNPPTMEEILEQARASGFVPTLGGRPIESKPKPAGVGMNMPVCRSRPCGR